MNELPIHLIPELSGYIASVLVLLAFAVADMRLLRIIAILSNLAFIAYGALNWLPPVIGLHLLLLPLNIFRLREISSPARAQATAPIDRCPSAMSPLSKPTCLVSHNMEHAQ
jgi:hypothetical protein